MGAKTNSIPPALFDRTDTKAIKGIAVLLMLFHHLAGFPDRLPAGFEGFTSFLPGFVSDGYLADFAASAKICVSLFFFLGGYGLYLRRKSRNFSITAEILRLYKAYWKVFLLLVPVALVFFARSGEGISPISSKYAFVSGKALITAVLSDFTGWTYNLNPEWWFFRTYVCVIPLGCLFCGAAEKDRSFWKEIIYVFLIDILIRDLLPALVKTELLAPLGKNVYFSGFFMLNKYAGAFFAGIVLAKYDGIRCLKRRLLKLPGTAVICTLGLCALWWCRTFVLRGEADIVYCALMVPMASVLLDKARSGKKFFAFFGSHSTNIWLTHSFFCYYFLEVTHLVYGFRNVWADFAVLTALSLAASVAINGFYRLAGKGLVHFRKYTETTGGDGV